MADFRATPAIDDRFVWLQGELDMWSADGFLATMSAAALAGGPVLIDLTRLAFVDSDGIRALLSVAQRVGGRGCLILHNPTPHVAKVFDIVGLPRVANVHVLDGGHGESAFSDGPGAWNRLAAFHHLQCEVQDRLVAAASTARRTAALCSRTGALMSRLTANRSHRITAMVP